jgi:hypothetical protein
VIRIERIAAKGRADRLVHEILCKGWRRQHKGAKKANQNPFQLHLTSPEPQYAVKFSDTLSLSGGRID